MFLIYSDKCIYCGLSYLTSDLTCHCRELDDELQDSVYEFLEERGINDELATFLHEYMANKDKTEFIKWLGTVKSFVEKK